MKHTVYIVADAGRCDINKVGAIAWTVIAGDEIVRGGRPVFDDVSTVDLELMAIREGLQESVRFRRKHPEFAKIVTHAITDNVKAYIDLKIRHVHRREYSNKHLLKAMPRKMAWLKQHHKTCHLLASEMLNIAREKVNE